MFIVYTLFYKETHTRIFLECKHILQMNPSYPNLKVVDWYICKEHMVLKVYDFEVKISTMCFPYS